MKIETCTENQGNLYLKHLVNWYIVHTFYIIIYLNILCPNSNNSPLKECLTRKCYVWANLLNKSKESSMSRPDDLSQQVATWYLITDTGKDRPQMPLKNMLKLWLKRTCFTWVFSHDIHQFTSTATILIIEVTIDLDLHYVMKKSSQEVRGS